MSLSSIQKQLQGKTDDTVATVWAQSHEDRLKWINFAAECSLISL
jgi:hypothetical protein